MIIHVTTCGWTSGPVRVAAGFRARWRGLRPRPRRVGLLLGGNLVHGRGMTEPLLVVGLDADGRIVGVERLRPGRFLRLRGAAAVLELPAGWPPPPLGAAVEVSRAPT